MSYAQIAEALRGLLWRPGLSSDEHEALERAADHYDSMDQSDMLEVEQPD